MPEPGELWTLAQAIIWIFCSFDDRPSAEERDEFISTYKAKVGKEEMGAARALITAQQRWGKFDLGDPFFVRGHVATPHGFEVGQNWNRAENELVSEIHRRQLTVFACGIDWPGPLSQISPLNCASLKFGEVDGEVRAKHQTAYEWSWRSIRFEAEEIASRWLPNARQASEVKPRANPLATAEICRALREIADGTKKKPVLKAELKARFPGRHITDDQFQIAFNDLPNNLKRLRGDSDKTLARRDNVARGQ